MRTAGYSRKIAIAASAGPMKTYGLTRRSHFSGSSSATLLSTKYSRNAPPTPATMEISALRILMVTVQVPP